MKERDLIEKYVSLLPSERAISRVEAEHRATEFLVATAHITTFRHMYSNEKIRANSMERAVYARVLSSMTGKKITENKVLVEADPEYMKARENVEALDNDLTYLKAYYEIFMNAHVFYRQLCKGEIL